MTWWLRPDPGQALALRRPCGCEIDVIVFGHAIYRSQGQCAAR